MVMVDSSDTPVRDGNQVCKISSEKEPVGRNPDERNDGLDCRIEE